MNTSNEQFIAQDHNPLSSNPLRGHFMEQFDTKKPKPDFSILQSHIKLPPLIKLQPEFNPLKKPGKQFTEIDSISNQLKKNIIEQRELLLQEFYMFPASNYFQFYFPQSKFPTPAPGQKNNISYERMLNVENQNTFRDKLSPDQIADIREKGQFEVKSLRQNIKIPYVWKMNETLFKGVTNVQRDWNQRLCAVVDVFQITSEMLVQDSPEQLANIGKFPWQIITLFFGKKQMRVSHVFNYNMQIAKDFWSQVMTKHYVLSKEWSSDLWSYLDTQFKASVYEDVSFDGNVQNYKQLKDGKAYQLASYNLRKQSSTLKINQLNQISNKFQTHWNQVSKKIFTQISNSFQYKVSSQQSNSNQDRAPAPDPEKESEIKAVYEAEILQKFQSEQFTYYLDFIKKQSTVNKIPPNVIDAILTMLTLMHIVKINHKKWQKRFQTQKARLQKQIKNQYPIMSLNYRWFDGKMNSMFKPVKQQLKNEYYSGFLDQELRSKLNTKQVEVFNLWVEYVRSYETRLQQKEEELQNLYQPKKTFYLRQMILPPYDIIRHKAHFDSQKGEYFTMPKDRELTVTTASCGWKFKLYCIKLKVWTVNTFVILVYSCWNSTFGLRCLCGFEDFVYDQSVEYSTGRVIDEKRKTVLGSFLNVLNGISKSRQDFEAQPDTGIFGKNCSRICNILQCYVFRFFIVGILVVLTLYPIAILLVSFISFFFLITIWAWMPIAITFNYLFNIFIFSYDNVEDQDCCSNLFPFFALIFKLILSIIKFIFYIVSFFIFMPFASIIIIIYACICRCLRSVSDCVVLCFLSCCGRVPSSNSMFAQKVSGPGMSSQFYMSINEEDVYYLIQAELQQIHLKQVDKLTKQKLNAPIEKYHKIMRLIVQPLIVHDKTSKVLSSDSQLFGDIKNHPIGMASTAAKTLLDKKLTDYMRRYPKYPNNVRFTSQELTQYFQNTESIVKAYVERHKLNKWIFAVQEVSQNDYTQLTRKIWIKIFNCGEHIFQPIQSIDQRIRLEDQCGRSYGLFKSQVGKVVNVIKGETDLKSKKITFVNPLNIALFSRKNPIVKVNELFDMWKANSDFCVFFNKQSPLFIFFPHLSIKELVRYQQDKYTKMRREYRLQMQNW